MAGRAVRASRVIAAPPERVWAALTDLERAPTIRRGVSRVEFLKPVADGGALFTVGARWRETRSARGLLEIREMRVVESVPPRRAVVESTCDGVTNRLVFTLVPRVVGTEVSVEFAAAQRQSIARRLVAASLTTLITKRSLASELAHLAGAAESQPTEREGAEAAT